VEGILVVFEKLSPPNDESSAEIAPMMQIAGFQNNPAKFDGRSPKPDNFGDLIETRRARVEFFTL
jgi:hypothetical protein